MMGEAGEEGSSQFSESSTNLNTRRNFLRGVSVALGAFGVAACGRATSSSAHGGGQPAGTSGVALAADCSAPVVGANQSLAQSGFICTGARMLWVTVPLNGTPPSWFLPPGLRLSFPAMATFFVAHYPLTNFGSVYNEAAVLLHVENDDGPAWHCPWIVVDDDSAMILGREVSGFPKKLAAITLDEGMNSIVGNVVRKGKHVLRLEASTHGLADAQGGAWTSRLINVQGSFLDGMKLLTLPVVSEQIHSKRTGRATLTLTSTDRDPLGSLLSTPTEGDAMFVVVDFGRLADGAEFTGGALPQDWAWSRQIGTTV